MMDVLRKWEAHGMKMAKIGVAVNFNFSLRKRIVLSETLDRMSNFEIEQEFQQASHDILEGLFKVDVKEAVKLAALQYCLQPLTAKMLVQMCIYGRCIVLLSSLIRKISLSLCNQSTIFEHGKNLSLTELTLFV